MSRDCGDNNRGMARILLVITNLLVIRVITLTGLC